MPLDLFETFKLEIQFCGRAKNSIEAKYAGNTDMEWNLFQRLYVRVYWRYDYDYINVDEAKLYLK